MTGGDIDASVEFRPNTLQILDEATCWRLVAAADIGRVGFVVDEKPLVLPVTHLVDDNSVVFRTAEGSKLQAAVLRRPVVFEVDSWNSADRSGWSVVIHGVATLVTAPARINHLNALGLEPYADEVARDRWIRIRTEEISGRAAAPKS
ncbi:MAG: pyridoxamine 5'-phosphate oxidase family protein [Acidimicrobiales bacterium]